MTDDAVQPAPPSVDEPATSASTCETPATPRTAPARRARRGLLAEYFYFFKTYKKWWLAPVVATVLILGLLVTLGGTKGALMIYALF